jgi:uncharacterized RDD family membrane protein YckC
MSAITILDRNNAPTGPFTRAQVADKLQRGEVTLSSLAFVEGLAQWTPLGDVLAQVDAANPPPPVAASVVAAPLAPTPGYSYAATMEPPAHFVYAGFWLRVVAIIIDGLVFSPLSIISLLLQHWAQSVEQNSPNSALMLGIGLLLIADGLFILVARWLYFALMESSSWQATLGKKALGLRVTGMDGQRIGFGRATGRYFGKILSALTLFIGFMMAGFTPRKQALHDMIAGTLVVRNS